MNGMKSVAACVLIILLGNVFLSSFAEVPEAGKAKPLSPTIPRATEKPVVPEAITSSKTESPADHCRCIGRDNSASAKRIEQALAGPLHSTGFDYTDQPLQDVVSQLSDEYGIPIRIDRPALEEAGLATDAPISITLHNISLRSALKLTLRPLSLTWIIEDEVLMITTTQVAERELDTCVYNVQGLVDDSDPKSVKALIDAIYACVYGDSWATNGGGHAEVRPLPSGLLVVSQTARAQEEVSAFLNTIRKMREQAPLTKVGPRGYEPPPARSRANTTKRPEKGRRTGGEAISGNPFAD